MDESRKAVAFDPVERPRHYNVDPSGVECVELAELMRFTSGNAIKYIWRAGLKDTETDLRDLSKALWYIQRTLDLDKDRIENSSTNRLARLEILRKVAPHRHEAIRGVLQHLIEAESILDPRERLNLHKLALLELKHYILVTEQDRT